MKGPVPPRRDWLLRWWHRHIVTADPSPRYSALDVLDGLPRRRSP